MAQYYVLGIEGSANKIGIGIVDSQGNILANPRWTFITPPGTGFIPRETAEHHQKNILELIQEALNMAELWINQIKLIAYTKGPGMGGPLTVGCIVARSLSILFNIPIVGVNHCIAHIEMGRLSTGLQNPVILYVSGCNTQVIAYVDKRYRIFGEALDIAIGNCLDWFAWLLNISNDPAPGYNIEQLAKESKNYIRLPYNIKGMDISFSGILSYCEDLIASNPKLILKNSLESLPNGISLKKQIKKNVKNKNIKTINYSIEDLCYSLQETTFCMLTEVTERALSHVNSNEVLIVGGVGCNERLQQIMQEMLRQRNGKLGAMDQRYCIDNGAMIAYTGLLMHQSSIKMSLDECTIKQRFRTDQQHIAWRD